MQPFSRNFLIRDNLFVSFINHILKGHKNNSYLGSYHGIFITLICDFYESQGRPRFKLINYEVVSTKQDRKYLTRT